MNKLFPLSYMYALKVIVSFFSDLPPSQGGRYAGFGSAPINPSNEEESSGKGLHRPDAFSQRDAIFQFSKANKTTILYARNAHQIA